MEYIWQIHYLDSYPEYGSQENVVCNVRFQLHAYSGSMINTITAEQEIPIDPLSTSFIPFESLTKDTVVSWIETAAGVDKINALKAEAEQNIIRLMRPQSVPKSPPFSN